MKAKTAIVVVTALGLVTVVLFRASKQAKASNLFATPSSETLMTLIPPARTAAITMANNDPDVGQLDPDVRNYVLETFRINADSFQVLVTKTASDPYLAGKEYWNTNQNMLGAIAGARNGSVMTISGVSHDWPAPARFAANFRMQAPVTWGTASAPSGLTWVYSVADANTYVCIEFHLSGSAGRYSVSSIRWYLAAKSAPPTGTYVFPPDTLYSLSYAKAPSLPNGYSWYAVTVNAGS